MKKPCAAFDVRLAEMRTIAIKTSVTWFLWVNMLFSSFILGRNYFSAFESEVLFHHPAAVLETMMVADLTLSAAVLFIMRMAPLQNAQWLGTLAKWTVVALSLCWAGCFFVLIVSNDLRIIFPSAALLLFTALISLYFDPKVLLSFILPVWLTILITSLFYRNGLTVMNGLQWILLAGLIESGRRILNSWFLLALRREQENADLIQRLGLLANNDPLTGIANRRSFEAQMDQAILRHQQDGNSFGLIMLDVDHFKFYNDYYGHQKGDLCLMAIARALESAALTSSGIVGRFGGEEFVLLLPDADSQALQSAAQNIAAVLQAQNIPHAGSPVSDRVTVSQGLALWKPGVTARELIARADKALYQAKQAGRNRYKV